MTEIHKGFQDVDQAAEADAFFAFLDGANALESTRAYRLRISDLCPPEPGDHIPLTRAKP